MRELPTDRSSFDPASHRTEAGSGFPEGFARRGKSFCASRREENFFFLPSFPTP
jgi:hypothetical protein